MANNSKKYQIKEIYLKGLLATINETETLPDINEFVQQIFFHYENNSLEIDTLCAQYYKRHEFGFQYLQLKLENENTSLELAKILFQACLELNFQEAVSVFDHLAIIRPTLLEPLLPLIIQHQVKLWRENIRVKFHENRTNRLLTEYRQNLLNALASEII